MAKKKSGTPKQVETTHHQDKRVNIPTNELRGFVAEDEENPQIMLYPRDPSLDPQLVWNGKDEQDSEPLAVPFAPIYIQEKIHPQVIVEEVKRQAKSDSPMPQQLSLFDDFNGIEFEQMIEFYEHEQNWTNRMILGDALQVMTSLAEKEALKGKVQMIYIDPPYGISFGSNWQVSTREKNVKDGRVTDLTRQPEQIQAFRDTWEQGIHSYLSYLRDRFVTSRELLTESGSIFVQIGAENLHLVRSLLDEVFGSENFCIIVSIQKTVTATSGLLPSVSDYLLWFAKNKATVKYHQLFEDKLGGAGMKEYSFLKSADGGYSRRITKEEQYDINAIPSDWKLYRQSDITSQHWSETRSQEYVFRGDYYRPGNDRQWSVSPEGLDRLARIGRLEKRGQSLAYVRYLDDQPSFPINNIWTDVVFSSRSEEKIYVVQTSEKVIAKCIQMTTDPGDLVLDPTCGSGTTAYVAEEWGRRWITIDTSRVALALARTRLMSARFPYYILTDSPEGRDIEIEQTGLILEDKRTNNDIRKGFAYRRSAYVKPSDIANNEEIDKICDRWDSLLEPLHKQINEFFNVSWNEWEIPYLNEIEDSWQTEIESLLELYWDYRRQRQDEVDQSIARNSENEILYDQPEVDNRKVRVTGAFTVESLSPHRYMSAEDRSSKAGMSRSDYENTILENLKASGVQNTFKKERLVFDTLDSYAGEYIHAAGSYTDSNGSDRRVAVFIGSEHGTVSPQQVNEAAKEAVKGVGYDVLIICGFAFDPHVSEEAKRYGKLQVLPTRMNPDLTMGDKLKTTATGNLFMVFGEPDIEIHYLNDDRLIVEIHGLDVYDPTTGQIRSNTTDEIACWFIDTDYDEESFFVRHAYFTGAQEPYDSLKRVLKAEIDEEAWSMLYQTESMPFERPQHGRIAVKVINHYGDEVLKVYEV